MEGPQSKLLPMIVERKGRKVAPKAATELELSVGKALLDIQSANSELAGDLRLLQIRGAREVEVAGGKKAVLLLVPAAQLKAWRRVQGRILRELEKKLGGGGERAVLMVAFRRIAAKVGKRDQGRGISALASRPRSHTLTAVHDAWLEDLVYPTEVVGKRIRVKQDGSRVTKVLLDAKDQTLLEGAKTEVMAAVYRKLTGKTVVFEFPIVAEDPRAK